MFRVDQVMRKAIRVGQIFFFRILYSEFFSSFIFFPYFLLRIFFSVFFSRNF
jgi:hypothetical protein